MDFLTGLHMPFPSTHLGHDRAQSVLNGKILAGQPSVPRTDNNQAMRDNFTEQDDQVETVACVCQLG